MNVLALNIFLPSSNDHGQQGNRRKSKVIVTMAKLPVVPIYAKVYGHTAKCPHINDQIRLQAWPKP